MTVTRSSRRGKPAASKGYTSQRVGASTIPTGKRLGGLGRLFLKNTVLYSREFEHFNSRFKEPLVKIGYLLS